MMTDRWTHFAATMLAAFAVTLSGCTTYVTSQVTAFSDWRGGDAAPTYAFARSPNQQSSIEQETYERLVASGLAGHGFQLVNEAKARYLVGIAYGSRMDQEIVPVLLDTPRPGPYWGAFNPWGPWGPFPPTFVNQTILVYSHALGIRITERAGGREVYNVTARTSGDEPSLVRVMPYLVQSALAEFPLANGAVRTVRLPAGSGGGLAGAAAAGQGAAPAAAPGPAH